MILIIDNYDSFTQNLAQCIGELGFDIHISRNDEIEICDVIRINPTHIIISPGPGAPNSTGISLELIKFFSNKIPILGVCLGHQSIAYIYGGKVIQLSEPVHGKITEVIHDNKDIFYDLPNPFCAARYHSLIIDNKCLPNDIEITARTHDGIIMACRHKVYRSLRGIQFHPESLWTDSGRSIIRNVRLV